MLRLFRKYNKYILAVGVVVLMIAFLIQPVLSVFQPNPMNDQVGTIGSREITAGQMYQAGQQLAVLDSVVQRLPIYFKALVTPHASSLSGLGSLDWNINLLTAVTLFQSTDRPDMNAMMRIQQLLSSPPDDLDRDHWMLALDEAKQMGLSASHDEVGQVLEAINDLRELTGQPRVSTEALAMQIGGGVTAPMIQQAIQDRIVYQQYWRLLNGLSHVSMAEEIRRVRDAFRFSAEARRFADEGLGFAQNEKRMQMLTAIQSLIGSPPISQTLRERFLFDLVSRVQIAAVVVGSDRYLHRVDEPDQPTLQALFDQYKEWLPGEGQPYGYGYRVPDRVKLEYLAVPLDRVRKTIRIEEADALDYYDTHQTEFPVVAEGDAPAQDADPESDPESEAGSEQVKPYQEVRRDIIDRLKTQRAQEKCDQIIKAAQAMLLEDARPLKEENGYRVAFDGWAAMPLQQVADQLLQQFDVRVDIHPSTENWLTHDQLSQLEGIGQSWIITGRRRVPFVDYVASAKELITADQRHPLASLRLQAKLPSTVLVSPDQTRYLFRLMEAQPNRLPRDLDEAREQVTDDAKQLAAYQLLKQDADMWLERVKDETLERLVRSIDGELLQPPAFPRRTLDPTNSQLQAPDLMGIGRDQAMIDAIFSLAEKQQVVGTVEELPENQRVLAIPSDHIQGLVLVRLDRVIPMTKEEFDQFKNNPHTLAGIDTQIGQFLTAGTAQDPMSFEALSSRLDFKWDQPSDDQPSDGSDP